MRRARPSPRRRDAASIAARGVEDFGQDRDVADRVQEDAGAASTQCTARSMSPARRAARTRWRRAASRPPHGPSVIALIVCIGDAALAHRRDQRSKSARVARVLHHRRSCRAAGPSRRRSARGCAGASPATCKPWPVTPMKRTRPSSRASIARLERAAGRSARSPTRPRREVVQLDEVDAVDAAAARASGWIWRSRGVVRCARRSSWRGRSARGAAPSRARYAARRRRSARRCRCG